ncbi:protein-tyrosine-phosphatase [Aequorivita xiaoshiensis]|uniref:Protein-tyrosine-phosphatase n=1 Tax=Aequorivita xiaoshiensis TaxID=2874476 RepID=A0A9X1R2J4_9FLAO|nr:protein-tyrosine-phosphatase [Aequorivita xiaoshiensis]MCG2430388.1 protein-tyrosine-phosphatase [Aequorivita xiaoshiensis]
MNNKVVLFSEIEKTISCLNIADITEERKISLQPLVDYIQLKVSNNESIRLNFICTHNSRRSHFAQIWAQAISYYFNLNNFFSYSAGTEATALYPKVVQTLATSGFQVRTLSEGKNPIYSIKYADNHHPIIGFSKKLEDDFNPKSNFAAIMTCDSANEACPFVSGAEIRIPITFEDPKVYDNTPLETKKYRERSLQIATELFYIFTQIKL